MEFRVLGPLQVRSDDGEIAISAGRQRALLAGLLLRPNRWVPTAELIRWIWGSASPVDARATTQTYVGRLRQRLGSGLILTRPDGYMIAIEADQLDLTRFDDLLDRARQADDPAVEVCLLSEALALWRGPALGDVPSEVLHRDEAPALTERWLGALHRRIELDLASGRHADLVPELHMLTREYSLQERFWAQFMRALAGCGRQAEALQAYQDLRSHLADELGIDPSPLTQELYRALLRGDVRPADTDGLPQKLGQVPVPAQLPPDVGAFTGRMTYLDQLDKLLDKARSGTPTAMVIAAIDGTAGVGKTALAVHWAHQVADQFPDGQLYINLRGYAAGTPLRPIEALASFLHAIGLPAEQVPTEVEEATAMYRSMLAGRQMLMILDNAQDPDQVRPLLPGSPGCLVVVTSRDRLSGLVARDGAHRVALDVLTIDETQALLTSVIGAARIQAEADATAKLALVCGFLPLALRIAAANLVDNPHRTVDEYVAELTAGDRLNSLEAGSGDQASAVGPAFDLSYARLPLAAQRMFRLLGLAPGPDVTSAAAAVLANTTIDEARLLLERLAAAHLLEQYEASRYAFHDLLRHYAAKRAQQDSAVEQRSALFRLYDYYLQAADSAARLLYPQTLRLPGLATTNRRPTRFVEPARAMAWLDAERANLVAITTTAGALRLHHVAWRLADILRGYFVLRAFPVDWMTVARAGLAASRADGNKTARAAAHVGLLSYYWLKGNYRLAIRHGKRALADTRQTGWTDGQINVLGNLGGLLSVTGQLEQAAEYLTEAMAMQEQIHEQRGLPFILNNLAWTHLQMGQLASAAEHAQQALLLNEKFQAPNGQALNHATLGEICHARGQLDAAADHFNEALSLYRALRFGGGEGETLRCLAEVYRDAGRSSHALELAQDALSLAHDYGNRRFEADALNTLAGLDNELGDKAKAMNGHQLAYEIACEIGSYYPQAEALLGLASVHQQAGRADTALAVALEAVEIARRSGLRPVEARALVVISAIQIGDDKADAAHRNFARALEIERETGYCLAERARQPGRGIGSPVSCRS